MRILLVGENSRLHNSLKEGLTRLNHDVTIVAGRDGFKNYEVDFPIEKRYQKGIKKLIKNVLYKIFGYDLESQNVKKQILQLKPKISNFDVVQFINESPFTCTPSVEKKIFDLINSWNKKSYLLSCGADHLSVKYAFEDMPRYSILTPYKNGKYQSSSSYGLKFLNEEFRDLHHHIYNNIKGVIASDMDYHLPLQNHPKYLGLITNPINTDQLHFEELKIDDKIIIFHGINNNNYYRKGNDIFEKALAIISKNYADKVDLLTVRSLPYNDYIKAYNSAHILLDQVYAYDQGYNALEAMAKGKVVFTGAEQEWLTHYNIKEDTVAINALPNAEAIAEKLAWLIENPNKILEISRNARHFIETQHHYIKSAEQYLNAWKLSKP